MQQAGQKLVIVDLNLPIFRDNLEKWLFVLKDSNIMATLVSNDETQIPAWVGEKFDIFPFSENG